MPRRAFAVLLVAGLGLAALLVVNGALALPAPIVRAVNRLSRQMPASPSVPTSQQPLPGRLIVTASQPTPSPSNQAWSLSIVPIINWHTHRV